MCALTTSICFIVVLESTQCMCILLCLCGVCVCVCVCVFVWVEALGVWYDPIWQNSVGGVAQCFVSFVYVLRVLRGVVCAGMYRDADGCSVEVAVVSAE